jgi:PilZ domain
MEHRWGERVPINFPVRLKSHPFIKRDGRLTNLSVSGAYIETAAHLRTLGRIEVSIPASRWTKHEGSVISGYVMRKYPRGFGIEWCEFAPASVSRLLRTVVKRRYAYSRRTTPQAAVTIARLSGNLLKHGK